MYTGHNMDSCHHLFQQLINDQIFVQWKNRHKEAYLTHFFASINSKLELTSAWELGFFDPSSKKITVFVPIGKEDRSFEIKPADDIFREEAGTVEELKLSEVKNSFQEIIPTCLEGLSLHFSGEQFGDGFLILQCWKNQAIWNLTLITKTLKFANLKINAKDGTVFEHQAIELINKEK